MTLAAERSDEAGGRGAVWLILGAMLAFAAQDVTVKLLADDVTLWQLQLVRSGAVLGLLVLIALLQPRTRRPALLPHGWRWPLIRAGFMMGAYLLFYASLPLLSLSAAAATFFAGPILITILAALLLGEKIGPRRQIAVAIGFAGVLLIVRPGTEDWQPAALMPLGAAFCYAAGVVLTRWRCSEESATALTITHNMIFTLAGAVGVLLVPLLPLSDGFRAAHPFVTGGWNGAGWLAYALMILTAAMHLAGMNGSILAYKRDEASRIAPFEYSYLAIMPVFDLLLFGAAPRIETLGGMALIAGSGGFVAWREGRPPRPRIVPRADRPWTVPGDQGKKDG